MEKVGIHSKNLSQAILQQIEAGKTLLINKDGQEFARVVPCEKRNKKEPRCGGQWRGKMEIPDDFDAPDEDIIKMFEGDS